jgi:hypothetical protein
MPESYLGYKSQDNEHQKIVEDNEKSRNLDQGSLQAWYDPFNTCPHTHSIHNAKQWKTFDVQYEPWVVGVRTFKHVYILIRTYKYVY